MQNITVDREKGEKTTTMRPMKTVHDLIEEAKLRTVWWSLCIFFVTYFLSHTSSSMWVNLPVSILFVSALRVLSAEVEFKWKVRGPARPPSYLSHLEKKQLSPNDSRLSSSPPPPRWKRKIDSPVVEAAINDFIDKILKDFVVDLWYSEITPDKEAPELIRSVIMDAIGEISVRVKEINLVDLLTRDVVDLIGDHLDLFRRNQASIGVDVMGTLSTEERDERLKHHLLVSKELHPALISPESEYKVLQKIMGGVIAIVLRPREAQCPLVRTIAREIVTCLVMQPILNLASPGYINQVIEYILVAIKDGGLMDIGGYRSTGSVADINSNSRRDAVISSEKIDSFEGKKSYQGTDMALADVDSDRETINYKLHQQQAFQPRNAEWARLLEAVTQRRTEVLAPENLENMWAKGRNYKKKENRIGKVGIQSVEKASAISSASRTESLGKEMITSNSLILPAPMSKSAVVSNPQLSADTVSYSEEKCGMQYALNYDDSSPFKRQHIQHELESTMHTSTSESKTRLKRSNSTSALKAEPDNKRTFSGNVGGSIISEFYSPDSGSRSDDPAVKKMSDIIVRHEGSNVPKLKCRVLGAYFEKLGSKSFAVYSVAVKDAENRTWFVKRRYSNFERLHRHLKDIPNYTLHLPPKRIFSSSTEDAFVHQRCIQLDRYLQDLMSIANVAEQHEVWDFLSVSSKNYSFGKSSSVMRTLAVNVDDAVDDIVRQVKGVSDGLKRIVGSSSPLDETISSSQSNNLSWHANEMNYPTWRQDTPETMNSISDDEQSHKQECHDPDEGGSSEHTDQWHSDNELNTKGFQPLVIKHKEEAWSIGSEKQMNSEVTSEWKDHGGIPPATSTTSNRAEDPVGMPPEWTPPNVSVPLLNLVDKVFQLKRRGWLRRHAFWMSMQIVQLVMEDAIDDWLLRQIYWLRREDTIAQGIRWVEDFLWPDGTFFTRVGATQENLGDTQLNLAPFQICQYTNSRASNVSFEEQLEASRRANDIKKMLFGGAPTALVSLIGKKQYKRCARDIFYFTQSTICVKQLAYAILELVLVSVFPELRDLLLDIHEKKPVPPSQ
ncbi:hypothetical protein K2173_002448 [Erythroxylum novogranatense]|uniref:Uncharacterized protein n=1 Tax=Erythroxylum novogranatense TaxID=1862640 RepID=A0AAV8TBA9_9ROSI|nr:hypothetical protein K2173_002448 [Erythroxylum novogranatense]